jgi:hypothetical protein
MIVWKGWTKSQNSKFSTECFETKWNEKSAHLWDKSSTHYVVKYHGFLNGFFGVKLIEVVAPLNLDRAKGRTLTPSKKLPNTGLHSMTIPSSMVTDREKGMNQKSKL